MTLLLLFFTTHQLNLFFSFIFISWRLITLQYYSGFCHTLTWISHGFTCVPILIPPPTSLPISSLWVFPLHQPWALVSRIPPGLVICFTLDSILVSMLPAIKKNSFESVLMRWMKLEPIIQSEVSQKDIHQYSILTQMEFKSFKRWKW